jgi:transposase InsO family protein
LDECANGYLSIRYTERVAEAGIEPSVGSLGDSYDNALAESVIGLLKSEVIRKRGPWKGLEEVEFATLECAFADINEMRAAHECREIAMRPDLS